VTLAEVLHGQSKKCDAVKSVWHNRSVVITRFGIDMRRLDIVKIWPSLSALKYAATGINPLNLFGNCNVAMQLANELSSQ